MSAELQLGDLNSIAGTNRCAVRGNGAIQHFGLKGLPNDQAETFFARRHGFDGLRKFARYVTNEAEFGSLLEGGVLRGARRLLTRGTSASARSKNARGKASQFDISLVAPSRPGSTFPIL